MSPLLEGAEAARAAAVLDEITAAMSDERTVSSSPSLIDGAPSRALYFAYLDQARPGLGHGDRAAGFLDRAIEELAEASLGADLYTGITGVAWTAQHLRAPTGEDPNQELDELLCGLLEESPWRGQYDLIYGLAGIAAYAIERQRFAIGRRLLALVVERLEELATPKGGGVAWHTGPEWLPERSRSQLPHGYYNLGVAHGLPAVIWVLGGALAAGVAVEKARPLYQGALRFLYASRLAPGSPSAFPYHVSDDDSPEPARAAWCYGDPGVAAALYGAALATRDRAAAGEALALARRAADRAADDCGVADASLCHGAAGLALIWLRFHRATGETCFAEAARRWYLHTLNFHAPGLGVAGYRSRQPGDVWLDDASWLTGACGVGLVLQAGLSAVEPAWDRLLATSTPRIP
jgi:hypothetical protein